MGGSILLPLVPFPSLATLHIHLDESGCFNFSPKGSQFYCFAALWTYYPELLAEAVTAEQYKLLRDGHDVRFHATEDRQLVRDRVVAAMQRAPHWAWTAVVVEKRKVNPSIRDAAVFYPKFAGSLLKFILKVRLIAGTTTRIQIITDTLPVKKHREAVEKAFKGTCRACLPTSIPFDIYHQPSMAHALSQAVDYCCWGLQRKWEQGDHRTYDLLKSKLSGSEFDILSHGTRLYY